MPDQSKFQYTCVNCGKSWEETTVKYLCPDCDKENNLHEPPKGVLRTDYDYDSLRHNFSRNALLNHLEVNDFLDLLPIVSLKSLSFLKVGKTPVYCMDELNGDALNCKLILKDDSQNPTFSFKDRASNIVSAYAKEQNIDTIITASTGNAGSSLAGICASQKQKSIIFVPAKAPIAKLIQIIMYGATIVPVEGTYDDAYDLSVMATKLFGWYNRNTAYNPLTIEGKKTVAFELFSQLSHRLPDKIFVSVGDGVILSSVYKGYEELFKLGITDKVPTIIGVQSERSANLMLNLNSEKFQIHNSTTIADSISVDIPRNFYMTKMYINTYQGEMLCVSDDEIMDASQILGKNTGLFSEPAASCAFAGFLKYQSLGKLNPYSENVVLLTGSGLKDLKSVQKIISMPQAINPTADDLKTFFTSSVKQ